MSDSQVLKKARRWPLSVFVLLAGAAIVVTALLPSLQRTRELYRMTSDRPEERAGLYDLSAAITPEASPLEAPLGLKLIYTAEMSVAVEKDAADAFPVNLAKQVQAAGGYVSDAVSSRQAGEKPSGHITVRVPSDKLKEVMDWIGTGATVLYSRINVQDITEQYVDLEARLGNLKTMEARLTDLLRKATGKLEDVLKVEVEMQRIRGEIEQWEGRKRLWDRQIALSSLTVNYEVAGIYRGEAPPAETFAERARLALGNSWSGFVRAMAAVAIGAIYAWPWAALLAVALVVVWVCIRLVCRKGAA